MHGIAGTTLPEKPADITETGIEPLQSMMEAKSYNYTIKDFNLGDKDAENDRFSILNLKSTMLIREGFITIGGEASSGKTSFVCDIALDIMKRNEGTAFLFYSLDDSVPMSAKRIISIYHNKNMFGDNSIDETYYIDQHKDTFSRIYIRERINIEDISREAEGVREQTGCNRLIIAIDYLQNIPSGPGVDRRQGFNDALAGLKNIQKELEASGGCILFCLSQLTRISSKDSRGEKKIITYSYRETSEIENQSDVCINICPDASGKQNRKLKVLKNKLGQRGFTYHSEITASFNFTKLKFKEDENQQGGKKGLSI
jgi:replicative DNA helicase